MSEKKAITISLVEHYGEMVLLLHDSQAGETELASTLEGVGLVLFQALHGRLQEGPIELENESKLERLLAEVAAFHQVSAKDAADAAEGADELCMVQLLPRLDDMLDWPDFEPDPIHHRLNWHPSSPGKSQKNPGKNKHRRAK